MKIFKGPGHMMLDYRPHVDWLTLLWVAGPCHINNFTPNTWWIDAKEVRSVSFGLFSLFSHEEPTNLKVLQSNVKLKAPFFWEFFYDRIFPMNILHMGGRKEGFQQKGFCTYFHFAGIFVSYKGNFSYQRSVGFLYVFRFCKNVSSSSYTRNSLTNEA